MDTAARSTTAIRSLPKREGQNCRPVEFSILGGGVTCPTGVTNLPTSMTRAFSHRA